MERERWWLWLSLVLVFVSSFIVKLFFLNKYVAPPGADYGNYLTQVDIVHGYDVGGLGLRYNPIFFILLDSILRLLDHFTALKIAASFVFSIVVIPFFFVTKKLTNNRLAALVSAWLFVFYNGYSEMIAWGGNPNLLGFSFMLLALLFLINAFEDSSKKNVFLAGFFASLAIGTHLLVAFFLAVSLCLFAVLLFVFHRRDRVDRSRIVKVLLASSSVGFVFSLPYLFVYLNISMHASSALVNLNLLRRLTNISGHQAINNFFLAIIVMLCIFELSRYFKRNINNGLILACLLLTPLILGLITEHPHRWLEFLPIPIMICFGLYLKDLFAIIRNERNEFLLIPVCLILIIGVGTTISSINRLETAIDYFQTIGNDEIHALTWIKENTQSNAVFATSGPNKVIGDDASLGNSYAWWIEGFSKRKCIKTGLTKLYTFRDERRLVSIANRIFSGTYVFEDGNIKVSEVFPASMSNPEIAVNVDGVYRNVLFLNDGELKLTLSPLEDSEVVWHETPFYAKNKTMYNYHDDSFANATFVYEWDHLKLIRNTLIGEEESSLEIIYKVYPVNSYLRQFDLRIWGSFHTSFENYEIHNQTIILSQKVPSRLVKTQATLLYTNGVLNETQVLFKDPKYSMPVIIYSFNPVEEELYVRIRLSGITNKSSQPIQYYDSYDLIKQLGINYIFLNKDRINEYHRFVADPSHFSIKFENQKIVIFQIG